MVLHSPSTQTDPLQTPHAVPLRPQAFELTPAWH